MTNDNAQAERLNKTKKQTKTSERKSAAKCSPLKYLTPNENISKCI